MQRSETTDRQLSEIAWLYYVADMTQGEIARRFGISRPTVLSYLRQAKERGLFEVRLQPHHFRLHDLAQKLCERLGLAQAYVVEAEGDKRAVLREVARAAAYVFADRVSADDRIGISWGETIWFVAEAMPFRKVSGVSVRQMIGSMANPVIQSAELCTTEIARRFGAESVNLNAPAICSRADLAGALREEPIIAEQLQGLKACNKALFSLSPCNLSTHVYKFKVCTEEHIAEYAARGAVGILAGRFFDAGGVPVSGSLDDRLIGVTLPDLGRISERILVASGQEKLEPTLAAIKGGYVTHLVTDLAFASNLLALEML